jgi:hypothetical protein
VAHRLRYGVADVVQSDEVHFELVDDVGELPKGTKLSFGVGGEGTGRAYLPVEAAGAEVLAVDDQGRPALLRNRTGAGWMVLCTHPLEHWAASRPAANPEPTWQLYSALAGISGVSRPLRVEDPRVTVGALRIGEKDAFLALNLSPVSVQAELVAPGSFIYLASSSSGQSIGSLQLDPYEVALLYRRAE